MRRTTASVDVLGGRIVFDVWRHEPSVLDPIVLIHGTAANRYWWEHIAEHLAEHRTVAALDLSGQGDSAHRAAYDIPTWIREVRAVIGSVTSAVPEQAYIVGHSLGGVVAASVAVAEPDITAGVILCETIRSSAAAHLPRMERRERTYFDSRSEALARFAKLRTVGAPSLVRTIGERSVIEDRGRWTWKHDPNVASDMQPQMPLLDDLLRDATCPVAIVVGDRGMVPNADVISLRAAVGGRLEIEHIVDSGHHVLLDRPDQLLETVREIRKMGLVLYDIVDTDCRVVLMFVWRSASTVNKRDGNPPVELMR